MLNNSISCLNRIKKYNTLWNRRGGLLLLIFAILQAFRLNDPYHWDEMAVYGRAVLAMYDSGLSVLPNAIPDELSRGHPLLFVFLVACWKSIFGVSVWTGHCFALLVSLGLLMSVYIIGKQWFSPKVGFGAMLLLAIQPVFFTQAIFILPEIALALAVLWASVCWLSKKWKGFVVWSIVAVWLKETAVVLPCAILCSAIVTHFYQKKKITNWWWWVIPIIAFLGFLVTQKMQLGYYFFPYHLQLISRNPVDVLARLWQTINFILLEQGRFVWCLWLIFVIRDNFNSLSLKKPKHLFVFFLLSGFVAFTALNYFMKRYLIVLLPFLSIYLAHALIQVKLNTKKILLTFSCILQFVFIYPFWMSDLSEDADFRYYRLQNALLEVVDFLEKEAIIGQPLYTTFPLLNALEDARLGYLKGEKNNQFSPIAHANYNINLKIDYGIVNTICKTDSFFFNKKNICLYRKNGLEIVLYKLK